MASSKGQHDDGTGESAAMHTLSCIPLPAIYWSGMQEPSFFPNALLRELTGLPNACATGVMTGKIHPDCLKQFRDMLVNPENYSEGLGISMETRAGVYSYTHAYASNCDSGVLVCFSPARTEKVQAAKADNSDYYERVADALPLGILVVGLGESGVVSSINGAFENMCAVRRADVMGKHYTIAFPLDAQLPLRRMLASAIAKGDISKAERFASIGSSGMRRVLDLSAKRLDTNKAGENAVLLTLADVTVQVRAQDEQARIAEALALREEGYRALAENSSDLITRHGYDGIILFASNASQKMLGVDCNALVGHCLDEYIIAEDRAVFRDCILSLQMEGGTSSITFRMRDGDGRWIWAETSATARRGKRGGVELTCVTRDISDRKNAEDKMRALQNQLASAIENMDAGIVMYDKDDKLVFCNRLYRYYFPGLDSLIVPGTPYSVIISAMIDHAITDDRIGRREELKAIRIKEHRERTGRVRQHRISDGRWLNVSDHPTSDGGVVSLLTDITVLKQAQDEIQRQRLFVTSLLDSIPDLITYRDMSGVFLSCNPSFCQFVGKKREDIIGRNERDLFPSETVDVVGLGDRKMLDCGQAAKEEIIAQDLDGRNVPLEVVRAPVRSEEGDVVGIVGIARDISDRYRVETMLKAESSRLRTLINSLEGGVLVMDENMLVMLANEGFLSLFRLEGVTEDLVGRRCSDIMPKALGENGMQAASPCAILQKVFEEARPVREEVIELPDGAFIEYDFIPIEIAEGVRNYLWHFKDVTMRRLVEIELQQRDTLLSGLAQTVRQLLAGLDEFDASITEAFRIMAETACIERIIVMQNHPMEDNPQSVGTRTLYRWSRAMGRAACSPTFADLPFDPVFSDWYRELSRGVIIACSFDELTEQEQEVLRPFSFGSLLVAPMFIEGEFWGMMLFDSRPNREWTSSDRGILRMVADSVGMAIQRKAAYDQLNEALAEAERMAEEARKANQAKTDFLASMSHEIRTPLNGVVGYSNLLRNTLLTARQSELLHGIDRSTGMLLALINDILDLSKVSAGQLSLDHMAFCPAMAVEDVMAALGPKAAEKRLSVTFDCAPSLRQLFMGDERRLKQILLNLLGNAIKFTDSGSVRVTGSSGAVDSNGQVRLDFSVSDTGIGISKENQAKLFQPFSQAENEISRRFGGTGLGLAICKKIVELMGGAITVDSRLGEGSTFSFYLFCSMATEGLSLEDSVTQGVLEGRLGLDVPLKILIADDNMINQEVLSLYMEELGYEPSLVADGYQALAAVQAAQVDLILMDIRMPGMDGMEATKAIREWEAACLPKGRKPVRIVALTADAVKSDSERCIALGMDDYLTKPVDPDQIERVIHRLFG
ncbi:MAG: PAS domain S-box protein [Opitutales bacterium]|nr:PAS domain S-box protein [Opitutales bacterium]